MSEKIELLVLSICYPMKTDIQSNDWKKINSLVLNNRLSNFCQQGYEDAFNWFILRNLMFFRILTLNRPGFFQIGMAKL